MRTIQTALFFLVLAMIIGGCSRQRAALYYFNKITTFYNRTANENLEYQTDLQQAIDNRVVNADYLKPETLRQAFVAKIDKVINQLQSISPFDGDTALRDSAISYFSVIRDYHNNQIKEMVRILSSVVPTDEDKKKANALGIETQDLLNKAARNFISAQQNFANKFGFPLQDPSNK